MAELKGRRLSLHAVVFFFLQVTLLWNDVSTRHATMKLQHRVYPQKLACHEVKKQLEQHHDTILQLCTEKSDEHYLYFLIDTYKKSYYLQLELSDNFLAPNFNIEEKVGDLYSQSIVDDDVRKCFYEGKVINDEASTVTINICQGLRGAIRSSEGDLFITPAPSTKKIEDVHLLHISEDISSAATTNKNKLKGPSCGNPESLYSHPYKVIHNYKLSVNESGSVELLSTKPHRTRRAASVKRYIETMVVTDESMFVFYGRNEIELRRYILSVMAIVTSVMKDRSIGNFVEVAVIKLVILKKNPPNLKINGAASLSLRKFCKWQKRQNKIDDIDPEHFDTAILLTRRDLCSTSCDTLGLAELGTACDSKRSCSIVEDNGLSSAFTIAHELGHLLNAPHDGDNNECDERSGKVHLMTPTFNQKSKTWTWSTCSRKYITDYLESSRAFCMLDKPSPKFEHPLPLKLPGEMFTLEEQCQLVYGDNSSFCNEYDTCSRLWCYQYKGGKRSCQSNNMPWADGTKCGKKAWCIRGKCLKKQRLNPVHGQWGSWSAFDGCSRTCGGGVKYAKRKCNKPKPANNGNYCIGPRHKYKSCNTQACHKPEKSFRAIQCSKFNGKDLQIPGVRNGITWLPRIEAEDNCKLFCEMKGYTGIYYELAPKVIDGTKCNHGSSDICVDGVCRPAGCDNVLSSNAKVDNCGVCNGDNSTCRTYTGYKNSTVYGYNFVAHIPTGASRLNVLQQSCKPGTHDTNFLALLNHNKRYVFNGDWTVSFGLVKYTLGGNTVYYSGAQPENETIRIPSTLKTAVEIQVLSTEPSKRCNIRYSYNFPISGKQTYRWVLRTQWSECFPICKGFQVREYQCERDIDSQVVSLKKCTLKKPKPKHRRCNEHCSLKWIVYPSECVPLGICGNGVQEQKVDCIMKYDENSGYKDKTVSHKDCHKGKIGRKPAREIPCYSSCSTVRWIYSSWSECNQSCGGGVQFREAYCVMQAENTTIPSNKCTNKMKGLLERPCSTHQCPKWHTGAWPVGCSVTCGEGVTTRAVYCTIRGQRVSDDACSNHTKPDVTRPCVMGSCADWKFNAWSKCSKPCGGGYQIREVFCETGNGEKVDDLECEPRYKPKNRQKCFLEPCVLWASLIYLRNVKWNTKPWSQCSSSCGGGYRERAVECFSNNKGVSTDNCNAATRPAKKERCNTFSCPFWRHGAWSKCTKECGNGNQTRLVLCGYNGTIVDSSYCIPESKPPENRFCNTHKCQKEEPDVEWQVSKWTQCSTTCGFGVKTRKVACMKKRCSEASKPIIAYSCNKGACPGWNYGQWTPCYTELGCGTGWQARLVVCQMENGSVLSDRSCDHKYRPVNNRTCEMKPCQKVAEWKITAWQPCNVPCGSGVQFRYVTCEDKQGNKLSEEHCLVMKAKPSEQKPCNRAPCPIWHTLEWSHCDSSCYRQREVKCLRGEEQVDDTLCALEEKPIEEGECNSENCIRTPLYSWKAQPWSPCGATCGYSLRSRKVVCADDSGNFVSTKKCKHTGEKPKTREWCFEGSCPPPQWAAGPWDECSKSCGRGEQSRQIYCRGLNGVALNGSACLKPNTLAKVRPCNLGRCGGNGNHWATETWTECTRSCGIGDTRRKVFCVNNQNITVDEKLCIEKNKPANVKVCNIHQCPSFSCRELQHNFGINTDGEQTLQLMGRTLRVYCEGMHRNNPKEFITLRADSKENFAEVYGKRLRNWKVCPDNGRRQVPCLNCIDLKESGVTFFKKVRIDIQRMVIIPEDRTFADRFGKNPPAFASAGDCYSSASCPQGRFIVNFEGTGLRVADEVTWTSRGYHTSQKIFRSRGGQMIHGKCGGYCGMCSPSKEHGLKVEIINR